MGGWTSPPDMDQLGSTKCVMTALQHYLLEHGNLPIPEDVLGLTECSSSHQLECIQVRHHMQRVMEAKHESQPPLPSTLVRPALLIRRSPADSRYGTQVNDIPASLSCGPYQNLNSNPPNTLSTCSGTSFHPYRPQSARALTPHSYSSHPTRQFVPSAPPSFCGLPSVPTFQVRSIHAGSPESSIAQMPGSQLGHAPSPQPFSKGPYAAGRPSSSNEYIHVVKTQTSRKMEGYVANDPFRVSWSDDKIDAPSDGLTFDDIQVPMTEFTLGPKLSQSMTTGPYEVLPSQPTFEGNLPQVTAPPSRWSHGSTQSNISPPLSVPAPHIPLRRPSWLPGPFIQPPTGDDISGQRRDSIVPSTHHSFVIGPKSEDGVTDIPFTTVSVNQPGDMLSNPYESQTWTDENSFIPYVPYPSYLQPFQSQSPELPRSSRWSHHTHSPGSPQPSTATAINSDINAHEHKSTKVALKFVLEIFPRQMYLHFLFRLPSFYFSRVAQIFEEADMSLPEIKKMALETASQELKHECEIEMAFESTSVPPAYKRLTSAWKAFVDSVMREWKTFNIISILLLIAILAILQIQSAAEDPLTKYTALVSLMCALMSLLFGCMYIVHFGSMRKTTKAAEWALEAKKTETLIWWNVWVLLAMPAIWLNWSIILYIACVMSFVWRSGATTTTTPGISNGGLLVVRTVIMAVFGIGMLYVFLAVTTFRRYGVVMDMKWKERNDQWIKEKAAASEASLTHSALNNSPYRLTAPYAHGSPIHQHPTHNSFLYDQPSFAGIRDADAGFSSGIKNRVGGDDDASDNENQW